jgi:hypothetical protein
VYAHNNGTQGEIPVESTLDPEKGNNLPTIAAVNAGLLVTRPDQWPVGTEIDFGGGLYGKRIQQTWSRPAGESNAQFNISTPGMVKFVTVQGSFSWSGNTSTPINSTYINASYAEYTRVTIQYYANNVRLVCKGYSPATEVDVTIEVYITYTKA